MVNHIKIHGVKPRIQYVANGNLKKYEFPFVIFKTSDVDVYLDDKLLTISEYEVSVEPDIGGGSISFKVAPANGKVITIARNLSIERTTDFQEGGALRANVLNDELDYQIACQQQIADSLNRSMVLPPYAVDIDVDLTLPTPSAGKAIVWNSDGTNLENSTVEVNALENTLRSYKESAESAATTATTKASLASEKADLATTQAQTATAQAGIAMAKAIEVSEALSSKANTDMGNLSSEGKKILCTLGLPSNNYIDIPEPQNEGVNNYTAPANGYIYYGRRKTGGDNGLIYIVNTTNHIELNAANYLGETVCTVLMPVRKNDVCVLGRKSLTGQLIGCRFYYAMGELS